MRLELGAYLLGALDAADRARVAAHLEACSECRDDLAELAPLPGLLARIPGEDLLAGATESPGNAERLLAQIARIRRRRRRVVASLAGACAAVAVGIVGTQAVLQRSAGPRGIVVAAANASSHVSGRATLLATPEGTTVEAAITGVRPGTRCQLIVLGLDGRREIAATWQANYEGMATVTGASALTPGQIRELVVSAQPGSALLVIPRMLPPGHSATAT
jgi:hypothetical protein